MNINDHGLDLLNPLPIGLSELHKRLGGGAIMAPPHFFHFQSYYRGMIHVISPIFHGESNGDNHLVVQQPDGDPEHHLDQQHGVGDQQ